MILYLKIVSIKLKKTVFDLKKISTKLVETKSDLKIVSTKLVETVSEFYSCVITSYVCPAMMCKLSFLYP